MARNKTRKNYNNNQPNFWGMIQNVLIASMNKGQFVIGIVGLAFLVLVIKLSPRDSKELIDDVIQKLENWYILGWFISVLAIVGWFYTAKKLRSISYHETLRISEEKKKLQQVTMNKKLKTSK